MYKSTSIEPMLYQQTVPTQSPESFFQPNYKEGSFLTQKINIAYKKLLEQRLVFQQLLNEQSKIRTNRKKNTFTSKNSIWDTVKLVDRFAKTEYQSTQAKIDLLKFDADHFAREMALVETITRFSYWHSIKEDETFGDGYSENLGLMLNTFAQDLSKNGFNASRATIESVSFQKAKYLLTQIALSQKNSGILMTSFPDDRDSGYHGVDSKQNWDTPETHHSFFYLLQVGETKRDKTGKITDFEIKTTQYRAWPNARQAVSLHEQLGQPIHNFDAPIPNLLFANLIELDEKALQTALQSQEIVPDKTELPVDSQENNLESLFREFLYSNSKTHIINHTHIPKVDQEAFWELQNTYFTDFYLTVALPVFEEIDQIKKKNKQLDRRTIKQIQEKIDYLDKAFFYYSKILLGWIKINNTNPNYTDAFKERSQTKKLIDLQQKLLLRLLGQKQTTKVPTPKELVTVLDIDHRLATKQPVSNAEKKKLLTVWGFFSFVGRFGSLLQCGVLTPFTMPLSILKKSVGINNNLSEFTNSIQSISVPEKQEFLKQIQKEEYVELDLTDVKPVGAKKIYSVPKSYLEGAGCIVDENGDVLGPCMETVTENGVEVKKRIPLDDPRDTLAFPMPLAEFKIYMQTLQQNIQQASLSEIDQIFTEGDFSDSEKREVQKTIKKLRQKLIKQSLGLQEFFTGNLTNELFYSNNKWLKELILKLSFSLNPVETLITEVEIKLNESDSPIEQLISE